MPVARVYGAAGDTKGFFFPTGRLEARTFDDEVVTLTAPIVSGPDAGRSATVEWVGAFDLEGGEGTISEWRESVGGKLCYSLRFDAPVDVSDVFEGLDHAFADGFAFRGNRFDNTMAAGAGKDALQGGDGDDALDGRAGDDRAYGGGGDDQIYGGGGDDLLYGGAGSNLLRGGGGDDILDNRGHSGFRLVGGPGDDTYRIDEIGPSDSFLIEGAAGGHDTVRFYGPRFALPDHVEDLRMVGRFDQPAVAMGNDLENRIFGTDGVDRISGGLGDDAVFGGGGGDTLIAGGGADALYGGAGGDVLVATGGRTSLDGGPGDDTLKVFSAARDFLRGGAGADEFWFGSAAAAGATRFSHDVINDFDPGEDRVDLTAVARRETVDGAMVFVGGREFSGTQAEVRYVGRLLLGDTDADAVADFRIEFAERVAFEAINLDL
jgi:hypothetical protein